MTQSRDHFLVVQTYSERLDIWNRTDSVPTEKGEAMKLELFDDDGNYIPNPSEPRPIEGEPMTIEGAIAELQNLIKADDVPFYYNGAIQKVIETIIDECKPKAGKWKPYLPEYGDMFKCSVCEEVIRLPYKPMRMPYNYCPMCGAKTEG